MTTMKFILFLASALLLGEHCVKSIDICGHQTVTSSETQSVIGEFPWLALLKFKDQDGKASTALCVGSLISRRYVLTAANCIQSTQQQLSEVRLGEHDVTTELDCQNTNHGEVCAEPPISFGIEKVTVHPNYTRGKVENDIALVRLDKDVTFTDFVRPICLPTPETTPAAPGDAVTTSGWGITKAGTMSPSKKKVLSTIITNEECRKGFNDKIEISDGILCTQGHDNDEQFTCQGDSGGPVMFYSGNRWQQEGIVSFGAGCGLKHPDGNTRLRNYVEWVQENMQ